MPLPVNRPIDIAYLHRHNWWSNVSVSEPDACWLWLKSTGGHGYGQTYDGITVRLAHRVAWVLHHNRQMPDHQTIDHVCFNKLCCNPAHLAIATNVDNARRNRQHLKTHCPKGHPYDSTNTYITRRGHRSCRTCRRTRWR